MKKFHLLLLGLTICLFTACHDKLWDAIDGLDSRVTKLEELCKEMNTNITSLQTIVDVLQSNDLITSIVEIKKDGKVVGYTITFGKHAPITIYHGQDGKDGQNGTNGKDGQNGADGKDGITPVIGVAQDTDGVYYWTLNGEWLLDDNGNKLPVSGKDGQNGTNGSNGQDGTDGKDGQDGKDGADGQDGKDGVTPQLKIEDGYWYISYDNGATWTQLGKATGENGQDGKDGADGEDGKDGDSMFQSVTQDENYVYFTLADGTVIKIAKAFEEEQPNSEFMFIVTYDANGGEGTMQPDTFYYGCLKSIKECTYIKEGYHCKIWNTKADGTGISYQFGRSIIIDKNITLYAQWYVNSGLENNYEWVDLGLSVRWASVNIGASVPENHGHYFAWGEVVPKNNYDWTSYKWSYRDTEYLIKYNTTDSYSSGVDIVDNKIVLDKEDDAASVNWGGTWRMPTDEEMTELLENCTYTWMSINEINGYKLTSKRNGVSIFLPVTGIREGASIYSIGNGYYYSSSLKENDCSHVWMISFSSDYIIRGRYGNYSREDGCAIRPVCP